LDIGEFALFIGAIVLSYGFFAYFSPRKNPFIKPNKHDREYRRVMYFRYVARSLFLSAVLALFIKHFFLSLPVAASVGAIVFALSIISPSLSYYRRKLPGNSDLVGKKNQKLSLADIRKKPTNIRQFIATQHLQTTAPVMSTDMQKAELQRSSIPKSNQVQLHRNSVPTLQKNTPERLPQTSHHEVLENSSSEEYEVEMAILRATAHIDVNLTDFDQSIIEADFEAMHSTGTQTNEAAQPDFRGTAKGNDQRAEYGSELTHTRTRVASRPANHNLTESLAADATSTSSKVRIAQENVQHVKKIKALEQHNQSLLSAYDSLIVEVSRLELNVKQRDAELRKNIALKQQALEIKKRALTMAAMERKRRKLTEIKARKIVMKLRNHLHRLEESHMA